MAYCSLVWVACTLLIAGESYGSLEAGSTKITSDLCAPWTVFNDTLQECECKPPMLNDTVQCIDQGRSILTKGCNCVSLRQDGIVLVGGCIFTCYLSIHPSQHAVSYHLTTAENVSSLNDQLCKRYNRRGFMCGECQEGFAPPVFSYSLESCVNCSEYRYNWLKYLGVAFLPQTILYFAVTICSVSVTSGKMVAYVAICQMITTPAVVQFYLINSLELNTIAVKCFSAFLSIWNLDLFRSLYPPFCLHPSLPPLLVISLDYVVGLYPLFLVLLTYVAVKIHDRSVVCVWLCRPVTKVLSLFGRKFNVQTSFTKGFASFLLLSYVKLLNVSFLLLTPSEPLHSLNGFTYSRYLRSDGTVPYMGPSHLPYAATAIVMFSVFNVFPLVLLCLYPFRCCRRVMSLCHLNHPAIHTFMDTFQGCYHHQPRDFRQFATIYLLLRICNVILYYFNGDLSYYLATAIMFIFMAVLVAFFKPYKSFLHSAVDVVLLVSIAIVGFRISYIIEGLSVHPSTILDTPASRSTFMFCVAASIVPLYGILLIGGFLIPSAFLQKLKHLHKTVRSQRQGYEVMDDLPSHRTIS